MFIFAFNLIRVPFINASFLFIYLLVFVCLDHTLVPGTVRYGLKACNPFRGLKQASFEVVESWPMSTH